MVHVNAATDDNRSTKDTVRARYTKLIKRVIGLGGISSLYDISISSL